MRIGAGLARPLASTCFALVFILAGIEAGLRAYGLGPAPVNPDQRHFWTHHPVLGWSNRANQEGPMETKNFSVHVSINSRGLRGPAPAEQKSPNVRRVLVIGDSFVWGFGVGEDATLTAQLESELLGTEVINGGVSGYSTDQALLWLRGEGVGFEPDDVVYVLSGNDDVMNHLNRAYWIYYKPNFRLARNGELVLEGVPVPRASSSERWRHTLRSHSAFAQAVDIALLGNDAFVSLGGSYLDRRDPHRLTLALVDAMRAEARRAGASFLVAAISQFWSSPYGSYSRLVSELRSAGHDVIDVVAEPGWDAKAMLIPGDGHWNTRGNAFVAGLLADRLRDGRDPRRLPVSGTPSGRS